MVSFHRVSPPKSCMHLSCPPTHAVCPANLILHNLSNRMFGEEYSWSSSLCSLLHTTVTSSLFSPNIFLSNLSSNTLPLSIHPSTHWWMDGCMYVRAYVCMCECMYVCTYVMYVCMYVYVCVCLFMYIHARAWTHTHKHTISWKE